MNAAADPPGRKPFDPGRVKPRQKKGPGDQGTGGPHGRGLFDRTSTGATGGSSASTSKRRGDGPPLLTVSQLTRLVKGAIKKALPADVHVVGELSNVASPASGHYYFTLKDESSEVGCVMWRSSAKSLPFRLTDGLAVLATGSIDVYEPRGQYQLYVRRLEPQGVGALELAFRQLKQRLESEGLFDPARKRPLPRFPQRIALVTSPTGAAVRDILQAIRRRYPCVDVLLFPVRVQGEGGPKRWPTPSADSTTPAPALARSTS